MKNFIKHYLGKGKQVGELQIVKVTCKLEDLQRHSYSYGDVQYVTLEIAKMKSPDNFGRNYTVYVSALEESPATKEGAPEATAGTDDVVNEEQPATMEECPFF